jgi:hypothetical protein
MYPLIIISRNRKSCVEGIVNFALGQKLVSKIIIMDMNSTFPPMIEYLEGIQSAKVIVEHLENIGPRQLWIDNRFIKAVSEKGFFLTDGDIDLSETSELVFEELLRVSAKYKYFRKIGCALRIDNLPINLEKSELIKESESDNWLQYRKISKDIFLAPIDTTLAFYSKYTKDFYHWPAIRVSGNCSVMHKPWYVDYERLTLEETFYIETAKGWGGVGTSAERGKREEDVNSSDTLLYRYSFLIRFLLFITPKFGSFVISKFVNSRNPDSAIVPT